jgi:uncharacterized membrane protein YeaQ/YmgE (transglycosylase-associated protein family)
LAISGNDCDKLRRRCYRRIAPPLAGVGAIEEGDLLHIIGTIIIGFIAGVIAKLIAGGPRELRGFILTTVLGIVGAFVATWLGQQIGWYQADQSAGFIGAIVGAVIVLLIWGAAVGRRSA